MTRTYTASDFANARLAEHPESGKVAAKVYPYGFPEDDEPREWESINGYLTNSDMARDGWVPVPTKPTITESELEEACGTRYESDDFFMGFIRGFEKAGGTVLEETTRERVARLVNEIISNHEPASIGEKVADRLISLELVKGN